VAWPTQLADASGIGEGNRLSGDHQAKTAVSGGKGMESGENPPLEMGTCLFMTARRRRENRTSATDERLSEIPHHAGATSNIQVFPAMAKVAPVHTGERELSLQRRPPEGLRKKPPARPITAEERCACIRQGRVQMRWPTFNYIGAGTVEFLL